MQVELEDVRCYYELLGTGSPLLMIPGLGSTTATWDCISADLADSFTLIMPELRGVNRSIAKRQPHRISHLVSDLIELLDYLQVDRAHVLGLSLGGVIAQRLAIDHPSRVDRLVLVSSGHRFSPYTVQMMTLLGQALRHFPREQYERLIELLGMSPQYLDANPTAIEDKIRRKQHNGATRRAIARQLRCVAADGVGSGAYDISAPTLILSGALDSIIPSCYAEAMAREIPNSQLEIISPCGHNPLVEKPQLVLPKIKKFLGGALMQKNQDEFQLPIEELV